MVPVYLQCRVMNLMIDDLQAHYPHLPTFGHTRRQGG